MSDEVRQDQAKEHKGRELTPEEDALRVKQLKASHQSHHAAGGCAEDLPKPAAKDEPTEAGVGDGENR